jgi:hypothetical protein
MEQLAFDQVAAAGTVLCSCGCGAPTPIARYTDKRTGIVKGEPTRCIVGHGSRKRIDDSGRECGKCGGYKPWEDFYVDRAGINGRSNSCKLCAQVRNHADNTGAGSGPKPQGRIDDQGRECTQCHAYRPWSDFPNNVAGFRGHGSTCRKCVSEQSAAHRRANPAPPPDPWQPPTAGCPSPCQYTSVIPLQYGIYVYRCWTAGDECIYVGKTRHALRRLGSHALIAWWRDVHHVDIATVADWAQADAEEIRQIRHWRPVNNSAYNRTYARKSNMPQPTHCPHGHEYTPQNTIYNANGSKVCRECKKTWARARPKKGVARGERQGSAKLTGAIVADMRRQHALGKAISALSRDYGVARATVRRAVNETTWAHVKSEQAAEPDGEPAND